MEMFDQPTPQEQTLVRLRKIMVGGMEAIIANFYEGQRMFWMNPFGLSPQQVFDLLATQATGSISLSDSTIAFINAFAPEENRVASLKPEGATLTIEADGRVTVFVPEPEPIPEPTPEPEPEQPVKSDGV